MSLSYTLLNTLHVLTEGSYLHLDNETVRIEVERVTRLRVPLHHLGAIVCQGDILISPALIGTCAERGIGISLLDRNGRFRARIEGPVSGNVLLRQAQHRASEAASAALAIARSCVLGKLRNSRTTLQRSARDCDDDEDRARLEATIRSFEASLRAATVATELDGLRGVEGEAARNYFACFGAMIRRDRRTAFVPDGRSRRPPRDRCNALLSYLYTLLTHDCRSALESCGLDPQVGFLHALRPGRPALALDLVEEFRSVLADRLALTLINRGQVGESDFRVTEGGAVLLSDDARRSVATAWQTRRQEKIRHPLLEAEVPYGLLPQIQARLLARHLRGDTESYLPYLHR
ncbi:MAG: type I-C CRISPR-associated endonuclease Cas1 [Xanthomonadales bacterium]|nr:CRISPR-associated exonuclease Cas4/endonuclease Cas1 fusion [Xanthomonadales bacterium]MCC6593489.1 type I-C CRISPR-associated endonuclease Cas1 [Xanthomonadales bacterium]MCE7930123.1 type I-C CRISPR-associated endonuclease Cas1 [Xanthomonadales bacterium PRO6]